jgi:hypothetical protein
MTRYPGPTNAATAYHDVGHALEHAVEHLDPIGMYASTIGYGYGAVNSL